MLSVDELLCIIDKLRAENELLKKLLRMHDIEPVSAVSGPSSEPSTAFPNQNITKRSPMSEKIALFHALFQGRPDVFAHRWESKNGRSGYSPACINEWKRGVCLKPKGKCTDCTNAVYAPYDDTAVENHLSGRHILGIYPMLQDETCRFLAIDFDEESWHSDVQMVAATCRESEIPYSVEISRSGNGAHLWIFFSEPIDASRARSLGSAVLTLAMREHARLSFHSYDRMFPNQDTMPKGGFGNLIALPLQVAAARHGGSLFVDEQLNPYPDQWVYLSSVQKLSREQVETLLTKFATSPLGTLRPENEEAPVRPWQNQQEKIRPEELPKACELTIADRLYIPTAGFSNRAQNQLKRIAAFRNPQYYKAQAMRMPVWNIPRVICCAEYRNDYLTLPRGCADDVLDWMKENQISVYLIDERCTGRSIDVRFNGTLREEQNLAFDALSAHDTGILSAATAFGKTVIGAALIAEKKVSTLVLVHRSQLMEPWIRDYGMVIVDECHHVPAVSFEQVLKAVHAKYLYGLTATPERQDGHHPILHMYIGDIRYHVDAKQQAEKRPFSHIMIPRFTGTRFHIDENSKVPAIGQYYDQIMQDDLRNDQIIEDVLENIKENRNCLLLSERTRHVQRLAESLRAQDKTVHVLLGGQTNARMKQQLTALKEADETQPLIVCATGKFIGEGFDDARLDTLFLTMPISWQGILAQYVGRLHRLYDGKQEVRVYDYVDHHAAMLEKMYRKRLKGYAAIGYSVSADQQENILHSDVIYDQNTFQQRFLQDIISAKESVVIVSPFITLRRVKWITGALQQCAQTRIKVTIITRTPESLPASSRKAAEQAIDMLCTLDTHVICQTGIHQKFAIMDNSIVWYGSINLLSFGASQESIMRLVSSSIARALMDTGEEHHP